MAYWTHDPLAELSEEYGERAHDDDRLAALNIMLTEWDTCSDDDRSDWTIQIQDYTDQHPYLRQVAIDAGVAGIGGPS